MSKRRRMRAPRLRKGPNGFYLCRLCTKEVLPPRQTFCGDGCVHEWNIRRNAGYVRDLLRERDRGVCALCHEDTLALFNQAIAILKAHGPRAAGRERAFELLEDHGWPTFKNWFHEGQYWQADHIIAVVNGGGACGLENFQTLCRPCHLRKSKIEISARRKASRVSA